MEEEEAGDARNARLTGQGIAKIVTIPPPTHLCRGCGPGLGGVANRLPISGIARRTASTLLPSSSVSFEDVAAVRK